MYLLLTMVGANERVKNKKKPILTIYICYSKCVIFFLSDLKSDHNIS